MASISLINVEKTYPEGVTAVSDFSLEISDKAFMVLLGPPGCGKSAILRVIAGLDDVTQGEVYIAGTLMNGVSTKKRDIAMVFQNHALFPQMTVYKNMAYGLELRKIPKEEIQSRVREAARVLAIQDILERQPNELSGSQKQQVALGRAMVRNPGIFLLDEPLSTLDAKLRASMRRQLPKLHRRLDTTFVYATQDPEEAMSMGQQIAVIKDGRLQQVGTPDDVYQFPANLFVAGFIGTPKINILNGTVVKYGGKWYVDFKRQFIRLHERSITEALAAYEGKPVKVGIRPENIRGDSAFIEQNASAVLEVSVDVAELVGSDVYLYVDFKGQRLMAKAGTDVDAKSGNTMKIAMDTSTLLLFDPETECAIE